MLKGKDSRRHRLHLRHRARHCPRRSPREGANVVINGFGEAAAIEKERAGIEKEFGVKAAYSPADMTKPAEIAAMIKTAEQTLRQRRHPGQQCRHPARRADRGIPGREVGPDHRHQPVVRVPRGARGGSRHEGAQMGPHHQHRVGAFARRLAVQGRLHLGQARARRPHQDGRARACHLRHHLQLHQPGLRVDAAGGEADPRHHEGAQHDRGAGQARRAAGRAADQGVRHRRPGGGARGLPVLGCGRRRSPAPTCRSTAAGPRSELLKRGCACPALRPAAQAKIERARQGRRRSTSRCKAAARTARSPGACSITSCRTSGSRSRAMSGTSAGRHERRHAGRRPRRAAAPEEARKRLADFWRAISLDGNLPAAAARRARPLVLAVSARRLAVPGLDRILVARALAVRFQPAQHQSAQGAGRGLRGFRGAAGLHRARSCSSPPPTSTPAACASSPRTRSPPT